MGSCSTASPHHHHADHEQRHLLGEALAQAVDRQQGQHHRLEGSEQHHRPGNRRQLAAEHQQAASRGAVRIHLGCAGAPKQNQRATDQQAHARPETGIGGRAERRQQQRSAELTEGITGAVQRHQATTPLLHRQLVDPAFTEDEHHGQGHADEQAQAHPDRVVLHQRQAGHRHRAQQQTQLHQHGGAEARRQTAGQQGTKKHADRRSSGHHTDGEGVVAPAFQAQRHQRHGHAQCQTDADDRRTNGEIGAPTHCRIPWLTSGCKDNGRAPQGSPAAGGALQNRSSTETNFDKDLLG